MTTKHKKRTPLIRRLSSIVAVFAIFIMSMPMAHAAVVDGTAPVRFYLGPSTSATMSTVGYSVNASYSVTNQQKLEVQSSLQNGYRYGVQFINIGLSDVSSVVGVYVSYYFNTASTTSGLNTNAVQPFTGTYINSEGNTGTLTTVDVDTFTPSATGTSSIGHSIKAEFVGSDDFPIGSLRLNGSNLTKYAPFGSTGNVSYPVNCFITSFRVITTEYSAELDAMENMADELAQQSEMMQAMYGEIIALCNAIYTRLGNMETALDLTKTYCQQMIGYLDSIDSNVSNIYELLGTQFALLISTIQTESSNIQDAIASAEAKLEAYFDAVGSGAVGTLPEETEDIEDKADGLIEDESAYESDASEQFADIVASFNGFSGGALNGVALATDLFTQIWNVLGEWKVVYTFPLIMGLVLLVIGRMSRFSGTMNSRNNGDKDVGGD